MNTADMADEIARLRKERDELAAHVRRYRSAYVKLTNTSVVNDYWERLLPTSLLDEFDRIDEDSPSTSLARRDARMKSEALERLRQVEADRDQMAALAEDRRQFIVSGAELGYISPPWDKDDPAYRVFQECNLVPSFAAASHDARVKAEALEECDADVMGIEAYQLGWRTEMCSHLRRKAAKYRKQAEGES